MVRRRATLVAAVVAAIVSLTLLWLGGASRGWLTLQAGAALAAVVLVVLPGALGRKNNRVNERASWLLFLLTLGHGSSIDSVSRWLTVGSIRTHAGLLYLVVLLICFSGRMSWLRAATLSAIALIIALQPDRGTALALVLGSLGLLLFHRNLPSFAAVAAAVVSFGWTIYRNDPLPPVPMVEHVLTDVWAYGWWAGAVCWLAAIVLCIAPAIERGWSRPTIIFAIGWGGFFLASLIGAYPVPLLGFGVSGWLGWALSVRQLRDVDRA